MYTAGFRQPDRNPSRAGEDKLARYFVVRICETAGEKTADSRCLLVAADDFPLAGYGNGAAFQRHETLKDGQPLFWLRSISP